MREDCAITVELLAAVVPTFSVDSGTFATVSAAETFAASAATGAAFFFASKIIMQLRSYLQQT